MHHSQLGSMAAGVDQDGEPCLFIAQPGGRFLTIHSDGRVKVPSSKETSSSSNGDSTHGAGQHSIADITTELEVLNQSSTLALCTMDGTIKILPLKSGGGGGIDNSSYDMPANAVWELNVDRELFSMAKVTGMLDSDPDVECVAACAWDGGSSSGCV